MSLDNIFETLSNLNANLQNRLVFSCTTLLIFSLLFYFWLISRSKIKNNNKDGSGLIYISLAFLLYAILGFLSVDKFSGGETHVPISFFIINGLACLCLLSSLSFFSINVHQIDEIISHKSWKDAIKYIGFIWVVIIAMNNYSVGETPPRIISVIDASISVLSIGIFGFFVSRYFVKRRLNFIALVSSVYFIVFIFLQLYQPFGLGEGKFIHMNASIFGPITVLSVIVLAYTFSWINELNFHEISAIWISEEEKSEDEKEAFSKLTLDEHREDWLEKISNDELEKVIEEIIILKKERNGNLAAILNIASRNTRNNNNHLKDIIRYDDYQLNRNKVSHSLITMLKSQ